MPINPKLKEQLTKQKMDDAYRTKLLEVLDDAPPEVQNNWMSQEDYTRQANAFKAEQATWKTTADKFYADSNLAIDGWKNEVKTANDTLAAAKARVAELEASGGPPKTTTEEDVIAKEMKDLKTVITGLQEKLGKVVDKEELNSAYTGAVGFIGEQMLALNEISAQHQEKFGKRFGKQDTEELIKYANDLTKEKGHRIALDEAYNLKYQDDARKKWEADKEKEIEERVKSRVQTPTGHTGATPAPSELGPLQIRLKQLQNKDAGSKDGVGYNSWQEAAAAGADELVKEGKY